MGKEQNYSGTSRFSWYHVLAAVLGFCIPLGIGIILDLGFGGFILGIIFASAAVAGIPPVTTNNAERTKQFQEMLASLPEPMDTNIEDWDLERACEFIRHSLLPRVWDPRVTR